MPTALQVFWTLQGLISAVYMVPSIWMLFVGRSTAFGKAARLGLRAWIACQYVLVPLTLSEEYRWGGLVWAFILIGILFLSHIDDYKIKEANKGELCMWLGALSYGLVRQFQGSPLWTLIICNVAMYFFAQLLRVKETSVLRAAITSLVAIQDIAATSTFAFSVLPEDKLPLLMIWPAVTVEPGTFGLRQYIALCGSVGLLTGVGVFIDRVRTPEILPS